MGGLNQYQYCPNPVEWVDPLGLAAKEGDCPTSKIPKSEFDAIRARSVHNPDSDTLVLGKYTPSVENGKQNWAIPGPDSYVAKAEAENATYFSLGGEWDNIKTAYGVSDGDMFNMFNLPVLDESVANGKKIKFSHNPKDFPNTALSDEWNYLQQEHGFKVLVKKGGLWHAK